MVAEKSSVLCGGRTPGRDEHRGHTGTVEIVSYRWRSRETESEGERREREREKEGSEEARGGGGRGKKTKEDTRRYGGARIRRGDGIVLLLLPFSLPLDLYPSPLDGVRR